MGKLKLEERRDCGQPAQISTDLFTIEEDVEALEAPPLLDC